MTGWNWDKVSEEARTHFGGGPTGWAVELVNALPRRCDKELSVLDLGCGLGRNSEFLNQIGLNVVATDLSVSAVIATAGRFKQKSQKPSVLLSDMVALPFEANSFEAVLAYNVIYHGWPDAVKQAVSEIHRVIRANGTLLVTMMSQSDPKWQRLPRTGNWTVVPEAGNEVGIPHHMIRQEDITVLFQGFRIEQLWHIEHSYGNPRRCSFHYVILATKVP